MKKILYNIIAESLSLLIIPLLFIGCSDKDDYNYENTSWRTEDCILTIDGKNSYTFVTKDTIIFGACRYTWQNLFLYDDENELVSYYRIAYFKNNTSIYQVEGDSFYPPLLNRSNYTDLSFPIENE